MKVGLTKSGTGVAWTHIMCDRTVKKQYVRVLLTYTNTMPITFSGLTLQEVNSDKKTALIVAKPQHHKSKQGMTVTVPGLNSKGRSNQ
jgi:hypothetical protein